MGAGCHWVSSLYTVGRGLDFIPKSARAIIEENVTVCAMALAILGKIRGSLSLGEEMVVIEVMLPV